MHVVVISVAAADYLRRIFVGCIMCVLLLLTSPTLLPRYRMPLALYCGYVPFEPPVMFQFTLLHTVTEILDSVYRGSRKCQRFRGRLCRCLQL
jgi:hypothetical protein